MSILDSILSKVDGSSNDKGYFANEAALNAAYPVGEDGWYATLGNTDTIWIWDGGTTSWVDSGKADIGDGFLIVSSNSTYNNVSDAVASGARNIFVDLSSFSNSILVESNDVTITSSTKLIISNGVWSSKRVLGTSYDFHIKNAGNAIWKRQNPTQASEAETFGITDYPRDGNNDRVVSNSIVIFENIVIDNLAMSSNSYGKLAPNGSFKLIGTNTIYLPNSSNNGISSEFCNPGGAEFLGGTLEIYGFGSSTAKGLVGGFKKTRLKISGEFIKNQTLVNSIAGNVLIYSDITSTEQSTEIIDIEWNLSNISSSDSINIIASGKVSNIPAPSNFDNTEKCKFSIISFYKESVFQNIDFNGGIHYQSGLNGGNSHFNYCKNMIMPINDTESFIKTPIDACNNTRFLGCSFISDALGDSIRMRFQRLTFTKCSFNGSIIFESTAKNSKIKDSVVEPLTTLSTASANAGDSIINVASTDNFRLGDLISYKDSNGFIYSQEILQMDLDLKQLFVNPATFLGIDNNSLIESIRNVQFINTRTTSTSNYNSGAIAINVSDASKLEGFTQFKYYHGGAMYFFEGTVDVANNAISISSGLPSNLNLDEWIWPRDFKFNTLDNCTIPGSVSGVNADNIRIDNCNLNSSDLINPSDSSAKFYNPSAFDNLDKTYSEFTFSMGNYYRGSVGQYSSNSIIDNISY